MCNFQSQKNRNFDFFSFRKVRVVGRFESYLRRGLHLRPCTTGLYRSAHIHMLQNFLSEFWSYMCSLFSKALCLATNCGWYWNSIYYMCTYIDEILFLLILQLQRKLKSAEERKKYSKLVICGTWMVIKLLT